MEVNISQVFEKVKKLSRVQAAQKRLRLTFRSAQGNGAGRSGQTAAGSSQSGGQCHQVHPPGGGPGHGPSSSCQGTRPLRSPGHRHRHPPGNPAGRVPEIRPGQWLHHPAVWRQRSGPGHLQKSGGVHGRPDLAHQPRPRARHHGLLHPAPGLFDPFHWRRLEDRERGLQVQGPAADLWSWWWKTNPRSSKL